MSKSYFYIPDDAISPRDNSTPSICLNMIVKNESKIIIRLLESVVHLVDSYCICDTGSNDNTTTMIYQFFDKHNIRGKITFEPFHNFEYNRTFALRQCYGVDKSDYLLLLDADMVLETGPIFSPIDFKKGLVNDAYYVLQGSDFFCYKNFRIVKNIPGISYEGVTHEHLKLPEGNAVGSIIKDTLFVRDIGDGGSKQDKFIRDIRLLSKGLEENPKNERYMFYLANSYRDSGKYTEAIDTYKKRLSMGGWSQEIWHSYYSIGNCYRLLENMPDAIVYWLEAYQFFPERIENLYEIINHYRKNSKYHLANMYYQIASRQCSLYYNKNVPPDYLFLQKDVYDYKLDYEYSIIGYYSNPNKNDIAESCMKVLNYPHVPDNINKNVLCNYKFYAPNVKKSMCIFQDLFQNIGETVVAVNKESGFVSSTPSICISAKGELIINVRFVNYEIREDGTYKTPSKIESRNVIAIFSPDKHNNYKKTTEFLLQYTDVQCEQYMGLDDIRLFIDANENIVYNASRPISLLQMNIEYGNIDIYERNTVNTAFLNIENQQPVEKNWVFFLDKKTTQIIYKWSPLTIGHHDNEMNRIIVTDTIDTPMIFKSIRGSTNGIIIDDDIWFICHIVSHEKQRYYYHMFVILDIETFAIKKYSRLFTFENMPVEYTLGMVYLENRDELLIGYSTMDRTTQYINISVETASNLLY